MSAVGGRGVPVSDFLPALYIAENRDTESPALPW
jgi:hypothetical protein